MARFGGKLTAAPAALLAWLLGLAACTAISVESAFVEPHMMFVFARLAAYLMAATAAALSVGLLALFGVGCGLMLWWLEEPLSVRRIAGAIGLSAWPLAVYMWLGAVLLLIEPPPGLTLADVVGALEEEGAVWGDVLAFEWLARLRYVVVGCVVLCAATLLARRARPANAILSVGFGAALVAALVAALGFLGSAVEPE